MSELKTILATPHPKMKNACDGAIEVYPKSEADKVIDFWKKESHDHYERYFKANKQLEGWFGKVCRCERAERELRHQKYRRCLAMAKWCENAIFGWMRNKESYSSQQRYIKVMLYTKWHNRWLKLAEQFKEAK